MAKQNGSQNFRLGDSYMNLIVGIIVVVAIGALIVGLIRGRGTLGPSDTKDEEASQMGEAQVALPAKHIVAQGEDLWKISEKYYKTGYNWVDIAKENKIANPNAIATGMELSIPDVTARATEAPSMQAAPTVTQTPTQAPQAETVQTTKGEVAQMAGEAIGGNSYTVVRGDYLWEIAIRTYGDGYKWVEIARANKLVNPNIIHAGNVLILPR